MSSLLVKRARLLKRAGRSLRETVSDLGAAGGSARAVRSAVCKVWGLEALRWYDRTRAGGAG